MNAYQFAMVRILLGAYLLLHFAALIPYSEELFSNCGVLPITEILPAAKILDRVFSWFSPCWVPTALVTILTCLSVLVTIGLFRRAAALLLWLGSAYLLARNPFIANPALPFVGLLLLIYAII